METHLISVTLLVVLFGLAWHDRTATELDRSHKEATNHNEGHPLKRSAT
jgi:hypothetical protein